MSWFSLKTDTDVILPALERIAAALERIAPEESEVVEIKPEDAVTYFDEEKLAEKEEADALGEDAKRLREWLDQHPEEDPDVQPESD